MVYTCASARYDTRRDRTEPLPFWTLGIPANFIRAHRVKRNARPLAEAVPERASRWVRRSASGRCSFLQHPYSVTS